MSTTYGEGKYLAEILDQGFGVSEAKQTPFFFLLFKILARIGADGGQQECPQYERTYRQFLANEVGVTILKADLKAIGVEISNLSQLDPDVPDHVSLKGRHLEVVCEIESYQGKVSERWKVKRAHKKLDLDGVRALDDKLGHVLRDGAAKDKPITAPHNNDTTSS